MGQEGRQNIPLSVSALQRQKDQRVFIFNAFTFDWSVPPPGVYEPISIESVESLMFASWKRRHLTNILTGQPMPEFHVNKSY